MRLSGTKLTTAARPAITKRPLAFDCLQRWSQPTVSAGPFRTIQLEHKPSYLREFNMAP